MSVAGDRIDAMVDDLVREFSEKYHADLEQVVTEAVCTGRCGVLVEWTGPSSYRMEVNDAVPYGHIYEKRAPWPSIH